MEMEEQNEKTAGKVEQLNDGEKETINKANSKMPKKKEETIEQKNERIYLVAVKRLKHNKAKSHKIAIKELESLGDWKDSKQIAENAKQEIPLMEEKEKATKAQSKKKRKKIIKIIAIIFGGLIALLIAIGILGTVLKADVSENENGKTTYEIHDMKYEVPNEWKEESTSDTINIYARNFEDGTKAVLEVAYTGESDLAGEARVDDSHEMPDKVLSILPDAKGEYENVRAKHSVFEISVDYIEGEVKGTGALLNNIASTFDKTGYINPRKSVGIEANYDGKTKSGTVIDSSCKDLTVEETYDTGIAQGTKSLGWMIEDPVTLKAGETSTVTVKANKQEIKVKITCTDMSEAQYKDKCNELNYKNQLRDDSFGEKIKIHGQVLQDCGSGYFRISSSGGYDDVYMVLAIDSDMVEDDWVTCYGETTGIYSYETVMGATQKIPSMIAKYVDR